MNMEVMMLKSLRCLAIVGGLALSVMSDVVWVNNFAMAQEKGTAYKEVDVKDGGTIAGTVKFDGDLPAAKILKVDKDEQTCGHENKASEELVINGESKGVKNVVVSLVDIAAGKKIEAVTAVLDQKECLFTPHVIAIPVGSSVDLLNSDNVMHNLHSWSIKNPAFNEGVSGGGKMTKKFDLAEIVKITCDVHKWMSSFIVIKAIRISPSRMKMVNLRLRTCLLAHIRSRLGRGNLGKKPAVEPEKQNKRVG